MKNDMASEINIDHLLVYCVKEILRNRSACTFEDLTIECFRRFPDQFSLKGHSEYPDSARVNKSWLRCRTDHGWLVGNVKRGFGLSPAGEAVVDTVRARLSHGRTTRRKNAPVRDRNRETALVVYLRKHPVFKRYRTHGKDFVPTESELRSVCSCTLDTPPRVVKQNLLQLKDAATLVSDTEVAGFMEVLLEKGRKRSSRKTTKGRTKT